MLKVRKMTMQMLQEVVKAMIRENSSNLMMRDTKQNFDPP